MKWACVGCGQGVDYHGNPITSDERQAWCYDCAEEIDRVAKSMGGARCRNCGNSGISPWTGKPCGCPAGKALARLQADNGVEVVTPMADERLRCGEMVRVIGPAATSPGDTFAIGKETMVAELRVDEDGHTVYACQIRGWGFVPFPRASLERLREAQASEPRAIVRHFAAAMERNLAVNDAHKGGWRAASGQADMRRWKALRHLKALREEVDELEWALIHMASLRREVDMTQVQDILLEAADVANYAMMICDVCGALPPTDERGR